ncbi:MAG: DUF3054 domain-containing protein [Gaiellales bacterium]
MPWLLLDVAWIVLFAVIGRRNHGEGEALAGVLAVAWPFLAGYVVGAFALRLAAAPRALGRLIPVWLITVVIGMAIRTVQKGRAPEVDFIIVATIALGVGLIGWRLIAALICRRRRAADDAPDAA